MQYEMLRTIESLIRDGLFAMNGTTPRVFIRSIQVINYDTIEVKFKHEDLTDEHQECVWYFLVEHLHLAANQL